MGLPGTEPAGSSRAAPHTMAGNVNTSVPMAWEGATAIPRHAGLEGTTYVTGLSHQLLTNTFPKLVKPRLLGDFLVSPAAATPRLLKAWHKYWSPSVCLNIFFFFKLKFTEPFFEEHPEPTIHVPSRLLFFRKLAKNTAGVHAHLLCCFAGWLVFSPALLRTNTWRGFRVWLSTIGRKVVNHFTALLSTSYGPGGPQLKPEDCGVGG